MTHFTSLKDPMPVGLLMGEKTKSLSTAEVDKYVKGVGAEDNRWYSDSSPFGGPIAPASMLIYEPMRFPGPRQYRPDAQPFVTGMDWTFARPIGVGETVGLSQRISDRWIKRGREHAVFEMSVLAPDGRFLSACGFKVSWADPPAFDPPLPNRDDDRTERPATDGALMGEYARELTYEMSRAFCDPEVNWHTNRELAKARGFPDVVISGPQVVCLISELATRVFGVAYFTSGKLSTSLLRPVLAGERLIAKAVLHRSFVDAGRQRVEAVVWCENAAGEKVATGLASALE